jgi:DNA mismatch endonuclease, patch repair protein
MADVVSPEKRSRMMSGIRNVDTEPEMILRRGLHGLGFRFRLNDKLLPGKPDLVFSKWKAVLFAHGCFWHGHDCHLFKWPSTRPEFWRTKISGNRERDIDVVNSLVTDGWRVGVVWECALKGRERLPLDLVLRRCSDWLLYDIARLEISGEQKK